MDENEESKREAEDQRDIELVRYLGSIGAQSLASELSDLRFRNRIVCRRMPRGDASTCSA